MQTLLEEKIEIPSSPPAPPSSPKRTARGFAFSVAALIPLAIVSSFAFSKSVLLVNGHKVCIKANVVDPYDLFRGSYLQIQPENVNVKEFKDGQQVFLVYDETQTAKQVVATSSKKPTLKKNQFMLKGTVKNSFGSKTVEFPFSKAFISAESAGKPTQNLTANLSVNDDGDAVLMSLYANGKKL